LVRFAAAWQEMPVSKSQSQKTSMEARYGRLGYLSDASAALDAWIGRVLKLSRKLATKACLAA
jgi:hypothetical protein